MNVVSVGLCTPLGVSWETVSAQLIAGMSRFTETTVVPEPDEPLYASMLSLIPRQADRVERMSALATTAILDALDRLGPDADLGPSLPLVLALPEDESGDRVDANDLGRRLEVELKGRVQLDVRGRFVAAGRAAFFDGLRLARELLDRGAPLVALGAVDSGCDITSLVHSLRHSRARTNDNLEGTTPGEGAASLLLSRHSSGRRLRGVRARVVAVEVGVEPAPFREHTASTGSALATVFSSLYRGLGEVPVDQVWSCQPVGTYWTRELVFAYLRNAKLFPEPFAVTALPDTLGDVGAAGGGIALAAAIWEHAQMDAVNARRVLMYGASDRGRVGACCLELSTA